MRWVRMGWLIGLVVCAGCYGGRREMAMNWAQSVHEVAEFPITTTHLQVVATGETILLTLTFTDAEHGTLDCGNGLVLKLYDPSYEGGKATLYFEDADGDGWSDIRFHAILLPEKTPMHAVFLNRRTYWEKFILPFSFE